MFSSLPAGTWETGFAHLRHACPCGSLSLCSRSCFPPVPGMPLPRPCGRGAPHGEGARRNIPSRSTRAGGRVRTLHWAPRPRASPAAKAPRRRNVPLSPSCLRSATCVALRSQVTAEPKLQRQILPVPVQRAGPSSITAARARRRRGAAPPHPPSHAGGHGTQLPAPPPTRHPPFLAGAARAPSFNSLPATVSFSLFLTLPHTYRRSGTACHRLSWHP